MLHYLCVGSRITITQSHTHTTQQTHKHKAVTARIEAKKLLSRQRQSEYSSSKNWHSNYTGDYGVLPYSATSKPIWTLQIVCKSPYLWKTAYATTAATWPSIFYSPIVFLQLMLIIHKNLKPPNWVQMFNKAKCGKYWPCFLCWHDSEIPHNHTESILHTFGRTKFFQFHSTFDWSFTRKSTCQPR